MSRTLQEVLNTDLSPDKVKGMTTDEVMHYLVSNGIVATEADVNMLIIEGIQKALSDDDEFPIHYYTKDEPMSEEGRIADPGPCLTDDFIENELVSE